MMGISIWSVDRESQEESLKESYDLDLSPLLFETKPDCSMQWTFDKLQSM